ncbi:medium-chain acyl-CoA ligase ACSF2, mitochondrial-like [Cebidichthys violaceus]|uniref:medium-chain acyl-CoA ligase ACSF2, mitochondrial-like n=1 Tax=Cebidichthys violaceus TaxID=271503 RepID=UPI0035C9BB3E
MSALLSSWAHRLRYVEGLQHKAWKICSTSLLPWCRSLHVDSPPHTSSLTSSYVHGTSSFSLLPLTVGQSLDSTVQRWPDREAVVFLQDSVRKTFAQFQQDVDKAAAGLLALGLKRGDRLGVWGPNTYEWILFQFASAKAGIILVSLNPAYQVKEVEFTLKQVQCKAVVCPSRFKTQRFCDMLRELCPEIGTTPEGMIKSFRFDIRLPQVRVCVPVPLYHCFGSVVAGMTMAVHGITLVFPSSGYHSRANLEAIQSEKCNFVYGTPTMFTDMLIQQDLHKCDLSSIEAGIMAGSPCPPEIVRKLKTDMNMKEITLGYGTTENSPLTFLGFPQDSEELKINTVGCIMSHTEAKVVDPDTGEIVPVGASGELMIRGSCVMHGYWNDPEKTREAISQDRWYRTGDTASLTSLGYCCIEGRIKDLIIRGGENIYPAEIEQFLFTHPKVQEVQVVGVKDERLGEQVCACIRLRKDQTSSAEEIRAFCKGQISHFKIPHYVIFVNSYPLTVSGKIKKNILKEEMEKKLGL